MQLAVTHEAAVPGFLEVLAQLERQARLPRTGLSNEHAGGNPLLTSEPAMQTGFISCSRPTSSIDRE